jgi:two-component system, LytTR family, response regulator
MSQQNKIKAILVDDEKHCIETLRYELQIHCQHVEIIETASSGSEGIIKIKDGQPDLVFLDIEMPGMSGFEMLRSMGEVDFSVIFVTAYDQYALQAFRYAAADYLLKPVIGEQLAQSVSRVNSKNTTSSDSRLQLEALLYNLKEGLKSPRIALPSGRGMDFVDANEIMYCNAESNYTHIMLTNNRKYTIAKTLKDVELMLEALNFFRVHQSYLINFGYLQRYLRDDGGYVVMSDGKQIPIAKRRKEEFSQKMKLQ